MFTGVLKNIEKKLKIKMEERISFAREQIKKAKLKKEKSLDISQCGLQEFPSEILELNHLEELIIGGFNHRFSHKYIGESGFYNEISEIPKEIHKLENLKTLDLTLCPNLKLPTEFGRLKNLETLILNSCGLNGIPTCIYELKNLRNLDLYSISDAERLAFHKGYSYQDFSDNYRILRGDLHFEELLHYWGNGERFKNTVSTISPKVLHLRKLEILDLNGNQIKEYPEFIDYHPCLKEVSMLNNLLVLHPINKDRKFKLKYALIVTSKNSEKNFEDSLLKRFEELIDSKVSTQIKKSLENSKIFFLREEYSDSLKIIYPIIEEIANEILVSNNENPDDRSKYKGLFDKLSELINLHVIPNELFEFIQINKPRNKILHGSYTVQNEQFLYPTALASLIFVTEMMDKLP